MCVTGFCHGPERPRSPGAICFWPAASWELFILALSAPFCLSLSFGFLLPRPSCSLRFSFWPSGVYFQLEEDALVFFCETKPLTGDSWGVTQNHAFSPFTQTVSIPAPFTRHKGKKKKKTQLKLSVVSVTQLYMLLCVMMIRAEGVFKQLKIKMCCVLCMCARERERGKRFKDREDEMCDMR